MNCDRALELVEPIAAGEMDVDAAVRAHLESCPRCSAELASARRLESVLRTRPAPVPPERFTAGVLQRIRRERWRSEQQVDRMFNIAMVVAVLLVVSAGAALMNLDLVMSAGATGWTMLSGAGTGMLREAVPAVNTYVAAVGLLLSALAMWWWADRTMLM
jgi:anti-sigma factor RsiW